MRDAELLERVDHRTDYHRERGRGAAFAAGTDAQRIVGRKHLANLGGEGEEIVGPRDRIIRERARQQLAALPVVDAAFEQGLPDPLCDPAMGLAMQYARIDRAADVVDGGIADDLDRPQFEVDLDFALRKRIPMKFLAGGSISLDRR